MGGSILFIVVILSVLSEGHNLGSFNSEYEEVYVSITGHDSASCGHKTYPCKSIAQAVSQVDGNYGHIYLNGTGTERQPFNCTREMQRGIEIQKSVSIEGMNSTPTAHISCFGGIKFRSVERELNVSISGIVFQQTPLTFEDCNFIQLFNSYFRGGSAVTVYVNNISSTNFNIRSSSFFDNNVSCVDFILASGKAQTQFLTVRINSTTFQGNGCFGKRSMKLGAITIGSAIKAALGPILVEVSCSKVYYTKNCGHFVNIELPHATINEVYTDVTLVGNGVGRLWMRSNSEAKSLFSSLARKTYAKFVGLSCYSNRLRCLMIECNETEVEIYNSSFQDQYVPSGRGASISLEATTHAALRVLNSSFGKNRAKAGGAISVHSKHGTIELLFSRVNFTACAAEKYGCTVLVGDPQSARVTNRTATFKLIANFTEVLVNNCSGIKVWRRRKCSVFYFLVFSGKVTINGSSWTNNRVRTDATFLLGNAGGKTDIIVSNCTFVNNSALLQTAVMFVALGPLPGSIMIENTTFLTQPVDTENKKSNALLISPEFRIELMNVSFSSRNAIGLAIFRFAKTKPQAFAMNIYIVNCTFFNSAQDIVVNILEATEIKFNIRNTVFSTKRAGNKDIGIFFAVKPITKLNLSSAVIELDNVTFLSRPCSVFNLLTPGEKTLKIRNSIFQGGICSHQQGSRHHQYQLGAGSISIIALHDNLNQSGCIGQQYTRNIHPLWNYDTKIIIEGSTFEGNAGLMVGAIAVVNGNVTFDKCNFRNNFGNKTSGHVYSGYGTGRIHFKDCSFSTTLHSIAANGVLFKKSTVLYSESGGPLEIENTSMVSNVTQRITLSTMVGVSNGGYVNIDNQSIIECSAGSQLLFENNTHFQYGYNEIDGNSCRFNVTALHYSCNSCPPGFYSLQKGASRGLNLLASFECLQCPFGATCVEKNVAARPNFWGYPNPNKAHALTFYACPEGYCQSPSQKSGALQYNACFGKRSGFLCGKCFPEYSETLFTTECRKRSECNTHMLWIIAIIYTTGMALYLLTKPPIIRYLVKQILWFRNREGYALVDGSDGEMDGHKDIGYLKIIFYFYQAADLLIVGSAEHLFHDKIPFVLSIIEAFNFEISTLKKSISCPFPGITAVTKELLLSGTVFLIMAEIVTIYCFHFAFNKVRRKEGPCVIHYIAVFIELLLLGYERLAESSLNLMNCFPIGSEKRLFIDAEIVCWQWWQYILLTYIIVSVVPFILILYFGSSKLHDASISAKEFLGACTFPLPFLFYWLFKRVLITGNNSSHARQNNKDVLEVLHGPFRQPKGNDNGTLYWESVLIGRRLALLLCHAFITNSMLRLVCMTVACIVILLHHAIKNPFQDPIANTSETASLLILAVMAVINLTKATLVAFGITIDGPATTYLEILEWFEVCVLSFVPALLGIFLAIAALSQLVRLLSFLTMMIFRFAQTNSQSSCSLNF
ncbi:uncharacterized protein [Montipora capricornis]|uniref:uncharacterized protein n=1 Tax=Montipora capricornis TaxID=246305 RepID=UPI0035F1D943